MPQSNGIGLYSTYFPRVNETRKGAGCGLILEFIARVYSGCYTLDRITYSKEGGACILV